MGPAGDADTATRKSTYSDRGGTIDSTFRPGAD